jgi:hypothetical protein
MDEIKWEDFDARDRNYKGGGPLTFSRANVGPFRLVLNRAGKSYAWQACVGGNVIAKLKADTLADAKREAVVALRKVLRKCDKGCEDYLALVAK